MANELNLTPELTLGNDMAAAAAEEITLTLGETPATPATPKIEEPKPQAEPVVLDDSMLSEAEKKA
ncbi:MAG: toxic anion resistance protein, partial [Oscillibacter sp.]|nr:toxic anion resistance protein [Oscillibacter sp.]